MGIADALLSGIQVGEQRVARRQQMLMDMADRTLREEMQRAQLRGLDQESHLNELKMRAMTPGSPEYEMAQALAKAQLEREQAAADYEKTRPAKDEEEAKRRRDAQAINTYLQAIQGKMQMRRGEAMLLAGKAGGYTPEEQAAFEAQMHSVTPDKVAIGSAAGIALPYTRPSSMEEYRQEFTPGAIMLQEEKRARNAAIQARITDMQQRTRAYMDNVESLIVSREDMKEYRDARLEMEGIDKAFQRDMSNKKYALQKSNQQSLNKRREAETAQGAQRIAQGAQRIAQGQARLAQGAERLQIDWKRLNMDEQKALSRQVDKLDVIKQRMIAHGQKLKATKGEIESKLQYPLDTLRRLGKEAEKPNNELYDEFLYASGEKAVYEERIRKLDEQISGVQTDIGKIDKILTKTGRYQISAPTGRPSQSRAMYRGSESPAAQKLRQKYGIQSR